jgi:hypothetical protein
MRIFTQPLPAVLAAFAVLVACGSSGSNGSNGNSFMPFQNCLMQSCSSQCK